MRTTLLAIFSVMLGLGCSAAHEQREVGSGIYDLTARGDDDRCTPTRSTGAMGLVGVVSERGLVNLAVPDGAAGTLARVSLAASDGFHSEIVSEVAGCEGSSLRRSWTILDTTRDGFTLELSEEWIGVDGCDAVTELAPEHDCRADRVLEYQLMETCAAPCEVHLIAGAPSCSCS